MKRSSLFVVTAALIAAFTLALLPTQQTVTADGHGDKDGTRSSTRQWKNWAAHTAWSAAR